MKPQLRSVACLLAFSITLSAASLMVSCGDSGNGSKKPESTSAVDTSSEPVTEIDWDSLTDYEKRQLISDNLPDKKFNGKTFRMAVESNKEFEIYSEELNGEVTNDAVYDRNLRIEDRFEMKFSHEVMVDIHSKISTYVTAADDAFDIMGYQAYWSHTPITAKVVRSWYDIPYMNFEQPWYNKITNDSATFNGKLFNLTCSLAITQMQYTYAMFFNQRIVEEFGYTPASLYQLVYDNEWTYDKFNEIISSIYIDENGDGKKDINDVFGYSCQLTHPSDAWLAAFGQPITGRDVDGNLTVEFNTEKTIAAIERIYALTYENPSTYVYSTQYDEYKYFANAKIAIAPLPFKVAFNELRVMEDSYGILPYPKWDSDQEQYLTNIFDQYSAFSIPKTAADDEFIGIIMEALNAESYKTVYPAFYDVALKGKYTEDRDTAEMVDIVMSGAGMDLAFMFGATFKEIPYMFRNIISAKSKDFSSKYKTIEKSLKKAIDKMYTYYDD